MGYSKYNRGRFQGDKPVKEGETHSLKVEGIGTKGDGIGKVKGFVVIVPNVKVGDSVQVKINAVRGKVAFAELVGAAETKPAEGKQSISEQKKFKESKEPEEDFPNFQEDSINDLEDEEAPG